MDTALLNGDFKLSAGIPEILTGQGVLLQRAALLAGVSRGGFVYDPSLGSRLHTLTADDPEPGKIMGFLEEALGDREEMTVIGAEMTPEGVKITIHTAYGDGTCLLPCGSKEE